MLDQVKVEYYGTHTPLTQLAQVTTPDANMIVVQPWDPSVLARLKRLSVHLILVSIRRTMARSSACLCAHDRRAPREVVKHLNKVLEEHRTAVRNIRRDGNDVIKKALKDKLISEDEEKRSLDEMQKLTDEEIKRMEEMSKKKEAEVMQV